MNSVGLGIAMASVGLADATLNCGDELLAPIRFLQKCLPVRFEEVGRCQLHAISAGLDHGQARTFVEEQVGKLSSGDAVGHDHIGE